MIPKVNLGELEIWDLFVVIHMFLLKIPSSGDINLMNLHCMTSVWPGNTSNSWNSCSIGK